MTIELCAGTAVTREQLVEFAGRDGPRHRRPPPDAVAQALYSPVMSAVPVDVTVLRWTPERDLVDVRTVLVTSFTSGCKVSDVASAAGVTERTVRNLAHATGVPLPAKRKRQPPPPKPPKPPLRPQLVDRGWIIDQFAAGRSGRDIARQLAVAPSTVRKAARSLVSYHRRT